MIDRTTPQSTQLHNIEEATGMGVAEFAARIEEAGLEKHGEIVSFLKVNLGLTHGNANLIAHLVRESWAGGPPSETELLEAQYAGGKAGLRPIYEELARIAEGLGVDVERVVLKTGVSFRRRKQFALVEVPSSKRIRLGINLDEAPEDPRVERAGGMCSHQLTLTDPAQIDAGVVAVLEQAYRQAG